MGYHQPDGWAARVAGNLRDPSRPHQLNIGSNAYENHLLRACCNCGWYSEPIVTASEAQAAYTAHMAIQEAAG